MNITASLLVSITFELFMTTENFFPFNMTETIPTLEEIHAELCYAELLCFKAMLTIIQDESLMAFVKAGLKIRSSYNTYK